MDFRNLKIVLLQFIDQLGSIQLAVTPSGLDDLGLLLQGEVLPCEVGTNVLLEQGEDLVVRDGTRVGEVVDAGIFVFGEEDGCG